jgi:hypothetical protein
LGAGETAQTPSAKIGAVARSLWLDALAADVISRLADRGARAILLKGPAIATWLYDDGTLRAYSDIDLLVSPSAVHAAEQCLKELGFESLRGADDRARTAEPWGRPHDDALIDLHTTLVGIEASAEAAWRVLTVSTERVRAGGGTIEVLAEPARALHVVLHAAQHGSRFRRPLLDLERALARLALSTWNEAAALAIQLDAVAAFRAGLSLTEGGRDVLEQLNLPSRATVQAALRAGEGPDLSLGLDWLTRIPSLRGKVHFLAQKAVPPPAYMRVWLPLARRGYAGLVAAYVWRPVWLLLKIAPAFAAWRRVRKTALRT